MIDTGATDTGGGGKGLKAKRAHFHPWAHVEVTTVEGLTTTKAISRSARLWKRSQRWASLPSTPGRVRLPSVQGRRTRPGRRRGLPTPDLSGERDPISRGLVFLPLPCEAVVDSRHEGCSRCDRQQSLGRQCHWSQCHRTGCSTRGAPAPGQRSGTESRWQSSRACPRSSRRCGPRTSALKSMGSSSRRPLEAMRPLACPLHSWTPDPCMEEAGPHQASRAS